MSDHEVQDICGKLTFCCGKEKLVLFSCAFSDPAFWRFKTRRLGPITAKYINLAISLRFFTECFKLKSFYTIPEKIRALWLAGACHLLEDRCTNDVTAWHDSCVCSKFSQSCRQIFSKLGPKQNEKCSALVEDFNEKQAAEYQSEWKAFNSAKHAKSLPG